MRKIKSRVLWRYAYSMHSAGENADNAYRCKTCAASVRSSPRPYVEDRDCSRANVRLCPSMYVYSFAMHTIHTIATLCDTEGHCSAIYVRKGSR